MPTRSPFRCCVPTLVLVLLLATGWAIASEPANRPAPFAVRVIDAQTGRGVPLVELRTIHGVSYISDSAGYIAIDEPAFHGRDVWFHITSHGYEYPADGFGYRGKRLHITPGGSATIELKRLNIAERLYRVTGEGIYRDSILLGQPVPIDQPLVNGGVLGQDSVMNAIYRGKLYWFWGDTSRASYPLGNFKMSGAVSDLPERGGLAPGMGVNLRYFVDGQGFSRPMVPLDGPGAIWMEGLCVVPGPEGQPVMFAHYNRIRSLAERIDHGLIVYNDEKEAFELLRLLEDEQDVHPFGHATMLKVDDRDYIGFGDPQIVLRVPATWEAVTDLSRYEAFTCLQPGSRYDRDNPTIERDVTGRAVWGWKRDTAYIDAMREHELVKVGHLAEADRFHVTRDVETGKPILLHRGTVAWNAYRQCWIMIAVEMGGRSFLGEVWYSEADAPHGPFPLARRIVTHDRYSFYNPRHHPYFDEEGGRIIYFEGTYAHTFSSNDTPTPRYDYNQIMYRLDLADERLRLENHQDDTKKDTKMKREGATPPNARP